MPLGAVGAEIVSAMAVNAAVTLLGPFIVIEVGLVEPDRFPDQLEKLYPVPALAEIGTLWPLLYQFVPEGLMVPPAAGLAAVVSEYCVEKFAVYVVAEEGVVMV